MNVSQSLNDNCESLFVVSHASKKENHFKDQVTLVANIISLGPEYEH